MNILMASLAPLGLLVVVGAWLHYLSLIPKEAVPEHPHGHKLTMGLGSGIAIVGAPTLGIPGMILAASAVGFALFFIYLLREGPLPDGAPSFEVGGPIPDFTVRDGHGKAFTKADLDSQRILLKFFRGHW